MKSLLAFLMLICTTQMVLSQNIRISAWAGQSYPGNKDSLENVINGFLMNKEILNESIEVKVLIVPHYPKAWEFTAKGFKQIENQEPGTVVIICNYHAAALGDKPFKGIAIDSSDYWVTPLAKIELDRKLADKIVHASDEIRYNSKPFAKDYTIELLLPFLQKVIKKDFKILPVLFGNSPFIEGELNDEYKILSYQLTKFLNPSDLIIISNDMAHNFKGTLREIEVDQKQLRIMEGRDLNSLIELQEKLAADTSMHGNIISCAIDGLKTGLDYFNNIGGGHIKIIDYGNTKADGYFVGFSSIMMYLDKKK